MTGSRWAGRAYLRVHDSPEKLGEDRVCPKNTSFAGSAFERAPAPVRFFLALVL